VLVFTALFEDHRRSPSLRFVRRWIHSKWYCDWVWRKYCQCCASHWTKHGREVHTHAPSWSLGCNGTYGKTCCLLVLYLH